ncbi:hypothetical protein FKG94_14680 [Exilibacterium tricleocarpae]|uniref:Uncharacterized protein n=1 Tax=Exilibacterium tricleocarpae TaxID=2591008 RepID=A0A545TKA2_9GAMM|nr:hypothetical protein [Exilibacterium tricleocarpae]TQV77616.1 hypothetical protein FKG94_14680 [Exilibacterium tricleocarpae]
MARTYQSLINHTETAEFSEVKLEADVIITCVILGLAATRYYQRQPFSYDVEYEKMPEDEAELAKSIGWPKGRKRDEYGRTAEDIWSMKNAREQQEFFTVMACLQDILDRFEGGMGAWLKDRQSQKEGAGELITGRKGGAGLTGPARDKEPRSWQTKELLKKLRDKDKSWAEENNIYTGRGAYIGIWDDEVELSYKYADTPNEAQNTRPPLRVFRADKEWNPTENDASPNIPWGVLGGKDNDHDQPFRNLRALGDGGMGPLPALEPIGGYGREKVGYIHGMSAAIHMCVRHGPWSTPYEVTVGEATTKISSCLACTTYMYALGYPPSSGHLGRGESWVPPLAEDKFAVVEDAYPVEVRPGERITKNRVKIYRKTICDRYERIWNRDITNYMALGTYIIHAGETRQQATLNETLGDSFAKKKIEPIPVISKEHGAILKKLVGFLSSETTTKSVARRFLDALTVHDSDWKRVMRTFSPLYERKRIKELIISGMVRRKEDSPPVDEQEQSSVIAPD